jgi:hypothetical protein
MRDQGMTPRAIRAAIDAAGHPALLLVDTVSSLASIDFRFDEWGVDVALTGTQKGLMLPPGTGILCIGPRALAASETARCPRYFFDWRPVLEQMLTGYFPYTPATLLLFGLREAVRMLREEGLENVLARHARLAEGVRRAAQLQPRGPRDGGLGPVQGQVGGQPAAAGEQEPQAGSAERVGHGDGGGAGRPDLLQPGDGDLGAQGRPAADGAVGFELEPQRPPSTPTSRRSARLSS